MTINPPKIHRILVIDDNRAIHDDIRRILISSSNCSNDWAEEEATPFAISTEENQLPVFEIDSTDQGLRIVLTHFWASSMTFWFSQELSRGR
jgi:hypothetical protein